MLSTTIVPLLTVGAHFGCGFSWVHQLFRCCTYMIWMCLLFSLLFFRFFFCKLSNKHNCSCMHQHQLQLRQWVCCSCSEICWRCVQRYPKILCAYFICLTSNNYLYSSWLKWLVNICVCLYLPHTIYSCLMHTAQLFARSSFLCEWLSN